MAQSKFYVGCPCSSINGFVHVGKLQTRTKPFICTYYTTRTRTTKELKILCQPSLGALCAYFTDAPESQPDSDSLSRFRRSKTQRREYRSDCQHSEPLLVGWFAGRRFRQRLLENSPHPANSNGKCELRRVIVYVYYSHFILLGSESDSKYRFAQLGPYVFTYTFLRHYEIRDGTSD